MGALHSAYQVRDGPDKTAVSWRRLIVTPLLDKQNVAKALAVSVRTVDRLRATGELRAVRLGVGERAAVRFEPEEVERLVKKKRERI